MSPVNMISFNTAGQKSTKKKKRPLDSSCNTTSLISDSNISLTKKSNCVNQVIRRKKTQTEDLCTKQKMQSQDKNSNTPIGQSMAGCKRKHSDDQIPVPNEYVALDCEFVGVGSDKHSALGRCSVVDYDGHILCDIYAKPEEPVSDYRTKWSGIRPRDLVNAVPFENARNIIKAAIKDRIVVGHAVHNDFAVLKIKHSFIKIRDTSKYKPLRRQAGLSTSHTPSLKKLTLNLLGQQIQLKEHSSVEDARATMEVFKIVRTSWEKQILQETLRRQQRGKKRVKLDSAINDESTSSSSTSDDDDDDSTVSYLADTFWPDDLER